MTTDHVGLTPPVWTPAFRKDPESLSSVWFSLLL